MNKGLIIIIIAFLFSHDSKCSIELLESICQPTEEQKELIQNGVFYCLNHIKEICTSDTISSVVTYRDDRNIQYLLNIFNISRVAVKHRTRLTKSVYAQPKLFINIESVYSSKRSYICKRVAKHFQAKYILSPPKFLLDERFRFTERLPKRIYYSLSKYSTSFHVKSILCTRPVVLERYWLDHAIFLIAKKYENSSAGALPPSVSTIYNWPIDLLKPDIVFYINGSSDMGFEYNEFTDRCVNNTFICPDDVTSDTKHVATIPLEKYYYLLKVRFMSVLRLMKGVKVVEINPNRNSEVVVQEIIKYIEDRKDTDFKNLLGVNNQTRSTIPTKRKFTVRTL